jgi:TonB-dependent receptor
LSLGLFQKSIADNIFSVTLGTTVIDGVTYTINQPRNTGDARISGLEVNFIRNNLDFLPSLFKNFGVSANATFVSSEATLANGAKIDQLNQMPNEQANFAVFYEADSFRARLTYAYVGERLTGITPPDFAQNRYDEPYNQLDAQVRFKVGRFDVIGEVRNLTDEHRVNYSSLGGMDYNFFGRQFWLGVALKR